MVPLQDRHGYDTLRFYARRVAFRQKKLIQHKTLINNKQLSVLGESVKDRSMFDGRKGNA